MPPNKLPLSFYRQPAAELAQSLIGKLLIHRAAAGKIFRARIVETEAYCGPQDLASHASKGLTPRTKIMFGPAGYSYVYFIYGMYDMFNIVAGATLGDAHAVLVRAAEALNFQADLSGPGKLTRAMQITRADNGLRLTGNKIYLCDSENPRPKLMTTPRIGVDYAKHWKDAPLRFYDAASPAVSRLAKSKRPTR